MTLRWTKSLRFQLTVWSVVTTALILLGASLLCYGLVRAALLREADAALQEAASGLLRRMAPSEGHDEAPEPDDAPEPTDPAAIVRQGYLATGTLPGIGSNALCLRLTRADTGQTAALSPNLARQTDLVSVLTALPASPHPLQFVGGSDDTQMRCLAIAVPQSPFVLQAALPWDPAEDLLTELSAGLALASLLFLLLSGIGSGLLVGRALRPMDQIVSEAEALTPDRLGTATLGPQALSDTEIGHLVAALNRMLGRISASFEARQRFTADASHELRTPLTILRGQLELALSRPRSAEGYRETLESGLEEVLRMTRIVESLAYLARGDAAGTPGRFAPLFLAEPTGEAVRALAKQSAEKNLRLVFEADGEAAVCGDADALRRLVRNLLENALAYTPPGGTVTVSVSGDAQNCRLIVTDTGVGIAASDLPYVFDRFFRADPARANTGGSGLGLSIVQSIAEAHGGSITVWSEPGQRSIFTVLLPRANQQQGADEKSLT